MKIRMGILFLTLAIGALMLAGCQPGSQKGKAATIKRYYWNALTDSDKAFIKYVKEKYNIDTESVVVSWDSMDTRALADIGAGEAPDILYLHGQNFPRVALQKVVVPLDQLDQATVNADILKKTASSARANYTFAGKSYAVAASGGEAIWVFFNKTMFEDAGLALPTDQLESGEWSWEALRKAAMALTRDTNGDGQTDQYGFATWRYDLFPLSNGGKFVNYTPDGKITLAFDSKLQTGVQFMQNAWFTDKYIPSDGGSSWLNRFTDGTLAMCAETSYVVANFASSMKDEWDFVPFPAGPDNKDGAVPGNVEAWGVCSSSKNQAAAVRYLEAMAQYGEDTKASGAVQKLLTSDQKKRIDTYSKDIVMNGYTGIGDLNSKQWPLWDEIAGGSPIATVIAKYKPIFQSEIDATLAETEPPKVEQFKGAKTIDFEDGSLAPVSNQDESGKSVGSKDFVITSAAGEVISGAKSLKITRQPAADPEDDWQLACRTQQSFWKLPSYGHTYVVSFQYKMLTDMASDGYLYFTLRPYDDITAGKHSFGWVELDAKKAGDGGTLSANITVDEETNDLCLVIGGFKNGDMVIDDLKISEK